MSENARLWKFWMWEFVLMTALLVLVAGGWFYAPGLADVARGRQLEAGLCATLFVLALTVFAYRLATGSMAGFAQWLLRVLGSGALVICVILLPVLLLRPVLKSEYLNPTSPFVALFVLWCVYGLGFLIQWQTRLFYRLMDQLR